MAVVIPFFNQTASFREQVQLDGVSYILIFTFNTRFGFWTLNIHNDDDQPIVEGIKLVLNYNLLEQYQALPIPQGQLFLIDTTNKAIKPTRENVGSTLVLYYFGVEEVATI